MGLKTKTPSTGRYFIKRLAHFSVLTVLTLLALVTSLGSAFQNIPLDSDTAEMAIIANGVTSHGLSWLTHWQFPPDNQILSLLPFAVPYYLLFGTSLTTIILQGWLIVVANALMTALIVRNITKSTSWGSASFILALTANPQLLGSPGFLAFPITHNIVWFFGLLGSYGLIRYMSRQSDSLSLVIIAVFIGTVSDPWFTAAFTIPAFIISWKSMQWFRIEPSLRSLMISAILIPFAIGEAVSTILHHLGVFLPNGDLVAPPALLVRHLIILGKSLLLMFSFTPIPKGFLYILWIIYVFAMIVAFILLKSIPVGDDIERLSLRFFVLSILVIIIAFIFTGFAQDIGAARFLVNVYYSVIVIISILVHRLWSNIISWKRAIIILPSIVLLCYVVLTAHLIVDNGIRYNVSAREKNIFALEKFLERKGLYYGFGPYFQNVNTMLLNVVSGGHIVAVPVSCDMGYATPFFGGGGNRLWLSQSKEFYQSEFFVFDSKDIRYKRCAEKNFGNYNKIYHLNDWTILEYHKNLAPTLLENVERKNKKWVEYNINRNMIGIIKVCDKLRMNNCWIKSAYSWLLAHGIGN
ncbi:MAG: hypothetical protein RE468_12135 [Acidithiobacillus caldus]|uniref:hypothetical protein n=1 Tax=Acidithiobacillus caldus TaxID=33059 RepID=UPI002816100D|nr:hypothetical protein [Acidithiobacillus caldus]WMT46625.1 MAG: hypothetical protein RE468_12135 [Acidithiobacillus caldus]